MTKTLQDFSGILFDVDMTLTTSKREVSPRLIEALKQLSQTSVKLGVCTGRAYVALKNTIFPFFPPEAQHVTAGGSQVITGNGQITWEELLSEETCRTLHQLGDEYQQMYYIPTLECGYGSVSFIEKYQAAHSLIPPLKPVSELTQWTPPFMVFVNISPEFQKLLEQRTDVTLRRSVSTSNFVSVDITPKGITKAQGVAQWCAVHQIDPSQVIGIGDSDNDVEFLEFVGYAVGMGNSTKAIADCADRVIGHTDENGLAVYLETLLKGSPV